MSIFNIGDRVRLARADRNDIAHGLAEGMTGTVLDDYCVPFVRWDALSTGHDGSGLNNLTPNSPRDVWAVIEDQLELLVDSSLLPQQRHGIDAFNE